MDQLNLAERLVNGLADENKRWKENVATLMKDKRTMIGDALVSAAFVSYIAPYSSSFRNQLWREEWMPDLTRLKIPCTEDIDPLSVLASSADVAKW